jgi:hypothetical protein
MINRVVEFPKADEKKINGSFVSIPQDLNQF